MGKRKNGFVIYFEEYMNAQKGLGRNISKKIAVEECGPKWQRLSSEEKKFYNDLANDQKCEKLKMKQESFAKLESANQANDEVKYLIDAIDGEEALKNYKFYVVHTNYYCKTTEALYVPAELAIAEFNLRTGILKTCHNLIDPGEVPLGYAYDAKRNSDDIHCIPLPPYEEGNKNFDDILEKIMQFMEVNKQENGSYAPLFAVERNLEATTNVLEYLTIFKFGENDNRLFTVYPIHMLLFWLKKKCASYSQTLDSGFPVLSNAWAEVERDIFRYSTGISCEFHKGHPEKSHNCSLSVIQRLVYVICDHTCQYLNIDLVLGKHLPSNYSERELEMRKQTFAKSVRVENLAFGSSLAEFVASGRSHEEDVFEKKGTGEEQEPTRNEEVRLVPQYDDDSFSSDDDLLVTIGRGRNMTPRQRATDRLNFLN